jgi:hypothetical protein
VFFNTLSDGSLAARVVLQPEKRTAQRTSAIMQESFLMGE